MILNRCLIFNWYLLYLIIENHVFFFFLESAESSWCNPEATWSCAVTRANQEELGARDSGGSTFRNTFEIFAGLFSRPLVFFLFLFFLYVCQAFPVIVKILMLALWTNNLHINDIINFFLSFLCQKINLWKRKYHSFQRKLCSLQDTKNV